MSWRLSILAVPSDADRSVESQCLNCRIFFFFIPYNLKGKCQGITVAKYRNGETKVLATVVIYSKYVGGFQRNTHPLDLSPLIIYKMSWYR